MCDVLALVSLQLLLLNGTDQLFIDADDGVVAILHRKGSGNPLLDVYAAAQLIIQVVQIQL